MKNVTLNRIIRTKSSTYSSFNARANQTNILIEQYGEGKS
jgi:hypothetical protein